MVSWDMAVMAMIGAAMLSFLLANGEMARVRYIQAMRRCLMKMRELIRYEQPELCTLLLRVELTSTREEKALTDMLHATARRVACSHAPQMLRIFGAESAKRPGYGVLSREDRHAFENLIGELGRTGLEEQLRLLDHAVERLGRQEASAQEACQKRAKLIRTIGVTGGAALFLLLV